MNKTGTRGRQDITTSRHTTLKGWYDLGDQEVTDTLGVTVSIVRMEEGRRWVNFL